MVVYDFKSIEKKWKNKIQTEKPFAFKKELLGNKYYCLEMYPYPSGNLHMGHVRNYSIGDVIARCKRLKGFNVLHPIGWDGFGLPAENAAIQNKVPPAKWTFENIDRMREELKCFGFSYDYDNEVCTAEPNYYKWGQWFFLKMWEKGLVYRKKATVNWDPVDKTVLAKEQVHEGRAWRSGALVERKQIEQWYIKITHYAEELLNGLNKLPNWPERVKTMQRNWIGKSEGVVVNFRFGNDDFPIFTTRMDTIFAASFMAIAFDHRNLENYVEKDNLELLKEVRKFKEKCQKINQDSEYEKEGLFLRSYIINPINQEKLPLYVTNFVLAEYGTGAVMGCPAHDERDLRFALKYSLSVRTAVQGNENSFARDGKLREAYKGDGVLVNSGPYNGLNNQVAKKKITEDLEKKGLASRVVNYRLKDWLISRQRYWGNPIPMLKDARGDYYPEELSKIPVELPKDIEFSGTGNPLETSKSFREVVINPKTEQEKKLFRETDTMDTFTCSSWYFLRYVDSKNKQKPFDKELVNRYLPVDHYIGGIEHACMHLLYARFFHKVIRDMGLVDNDEPFNKLTTQGMVVSHSYFSPTLGRYFHSSELKENSKLCPITKKPLIIKKEKMSKSKKNGVELEEMLDKYGADSIRLFILFAAPVDKDLEWNEKGIEGCSRFIQKIIKWFNKVTKDFEDFPTANDKNEVRKLNLLINQTIYKVDKDINRLHFNTAISHLMIFVNEASRLNFSSLTGREKVKKALKKFLILLSPFAPFISEELFDFFKPEEFVANQQWPSCREEWLESDEVDLAVQVNGKLRARVNLPANQDEETVFQLARSEKNIIRHISDKRIVKRIYVPNKLVNFVVKD